MKPGLTRIYVAALGLAMLGIGCSNTVEDVCEDLGADCAEVDEDDCLSDGKKLQSSAEASGCDDAFEEYLDCVADAVCSWKGACETERAALKSCAGAFP